MKFQIVAMVIMLGMAARGAAGYYTGEQILSNCESKDETRQSLCAAYLGGIADATDLWVGAGIMPKLICRPGDASTDDLREIFVVYANENPAELDQAASATVIAAFMGAFPCV